MLWDHCKFCWQKERKKEKKKFNIICLKLYQFERVTWWCLSILESIMQSIMLKIYMYLKIMGSQKFASSSPLGGGRDNSFGRPWNLIHDPPCRTLCRFFIHEVFSGPLGLHLLVWSEFGRSPPFRPMRALKLQWSQAFSLVCEVALKAGLDYNDKVHHSRILGEWSNMIDYKMGSSTSRVYIIINNFRGWSNLIGYKMGSSTTMVYTTVKSTCNQLDFETLHFLRFLPIRWGLGRGHCVNKGSPKGGSLRVSMYLPIVPPHALHTMCKPSINITCVFIF